MYNWAKKLMTFLLPSVTRAYPSYTCALVERTRLSYFGVVEIFRNQRRSQCYFDPWTLLFKVMPRMLHRFTSAKSSFPPSSDLRAIKNICNEYENVHRSCSVYCRYCKAYIAYLLFIKVTRLLQQSIIHYINRPEYITEPFSMLIFTKCILIQTLPVSMKIQEI